jgi:pimeloyl-ACP methyl ester carboxylesterase
VNTPALVVWGESDTFVPIGYGPQLAKALPNASFETIGKAWHFPHIEQANELVSRIERFATALRGKAASRQMEVAP